jgi:hypothetical protein
MQLSLPSAVNGLRSRETGTSPELRARTQQVLQTQAQQRLQEAPGLLGDQTQLSDELVNEVGQALQSSSVDNNNFDAMLQGLAANFLDRKVEEGGGAGGAEGNNDGKKEQKAEWNPEARRGQVIEPAGRIGEVTIKEEDNRKKGGKVGQAGKGAKGKGLGNAPTPPQAPVPGQVNPAQASKSGQKTGKDKQRDGQGQEDDKIELTPESQAMAAQMQQQGMRSPGIDPAQGTAENKNKGGGGDSKFDVHASNQGFIQSVDVRGAGPVKGGDVLMTYRKLDDMPSGLFANLKRKTGDEGVDDYRKRVEKGEQVPELTAEQKRQLLNPVATH